MRLIDADKLADFVCSVCGGGCDVQHRGDCIERDFTEQCAKEMPTVDAEPVVRCKDCRYYEAENHNCLDEMGYARIWNEDDYCSFAERIEDAFCSEGERDG